MVASPKAITGTTAALVQSWQPAELIGWMIAYCRRFVGIPPGIEVKRVSTEMHYA